MLVEQCSNLVWNWASTFLLVQVFIPLAPVCCCWRCVFFGCMSHFLDDGVSLSFDHLQIYSHVLILPLGFWLYTHILHTQGTLFSDQFKGHVGPTTSNRLVDTLVNSPLGRIPLSMLPTKPFLNLEYPILYANILQRDSLDLLVITWGIRCILYYPTFIVPVLWSTGPGSCMFPQFPRYVLYKRSHFKRALRL
ncbi:hypothetical protein J3A83DRAFT_1675253 [Scleroderma citrinum]